MYCELLQLCARDSLYILKARNMPTISKVLYSCIITRRQVCCPALYRQRCAFVYVKDLLSLAISLLYID